eukprot:scaffold127806_cov66-Phaeocystis_antarctica.AAC.3
MPARTVRAPWLGTSSRLRRLAVLCSPRRSAAAEQTLPCRPRSPTIRHRAVCLREATSTEAAPRLEAPRLPAADPVWHAPSPHLVLPYISAPTAQPPTDTAAPTPAQPSLQMRCQQRGSSANLLLLKLA